MTSIYQTIKADHARHRALLDRIAATEGDGAERRAAWREFYYDVKAHAAAEEETFYSRLMETPEGQPDARHSVAEHKALDDLMDELDAKSFSSPGWLQRFAKLRRDYEHHMEEEESDIFAEARATFDAAEERAFGAAFDRRKSAELGHVDEKAAEKLEE